MEGGIKNTVSLLFHRFSRTYYENGLRSALDTTVSALARVFSKGRKGEAKGTTRRGRSLRDGGNGRTRNRHFTGRGERRERSVTRGEKQERRKETRYLFYVVICCAINLGNIDARQELTVGQFLIVIEGTKNINIKYKKIQDILYFITLPFFRARVFSGYIFKIFFFKTKDLDIIYVVKNT